VRSSGIQQVVFSICEKIECQDRGKQGKNER
jgi:hypothetical protein